MNLICVRQVDINQVQNLQVANAFLLSKNLKHIHAHLNQQYTVIILINAPKKLHFKWGGVLRVKIKLTTAKYH